ncbi:MAG: ATP phosphoribosyltransferase regulatory subunit [Muribaculaceae bacterium]|nr:ATP phosphoribosyltransferase regulatory subunit [Roseburia sp.]MCM1430379.1 ATP phosphoribosyltransferase regulatory subunit [Muribaculaceae bacterium]MCM1492425.1 ATP phosphoribosyltransferase regulatory subunit [Muribaculaceae bacterium]
MKNQILHTPDGMRDTYNGECAGKLLLQERLHSVLLSYGYRDIQTPSLEFFNVFGQEIGTTPSKDLYKLFDKEGNTLVLRPDFTPSIARSAAKYYTQEDMPVKLCYMGSTFTNSSAYQGRLKENTQCGVELIGDGSVAADAEILAMVVDSLKAGGLREFQISVGHARFFRGLVAAAGLDEEAEEELRELISNKNFLGVEEFIETLKLEEKLKQLFLLLGSFETGAAELGTAKENAAAYPEIRSSIEELEQLNVLLRDYGIERYVSFELGIVSSYQYYTGIIFYGYTFGTGEPVVRGGRYDRLLHYFGKDAPSIGFAIVVEQLMAAITRQKIRLERPVDTLLLAYSPEHSGAAITKAQTLRRRGQNVMTVCMEEGRGREDYRVYAAKNHIVQIEFMDGNA